MKNMYTKTLTRFLFMFSTWGEAVDGSLGISEWSNLKEQEQVSTQRIQQVLF